MAETAISAVLSKFGELAANEAKILLEVGDDMALLRDRLEWLQAFIRDADRKRRAGTDHQLSRVWVRQTRDTAFQAEDALDQFFYEVDLKSQGYRGWKLWRKYLTGFCTQVVIRHGLFTQIKKINTRLEKISENQKEYKIEHTPLAPVTSSTTATSAWRDDAVGFGKDMEALKKMLLHEDHPGLMFISILGESGVGKDTLVDEIYSNTVEITALFNVKIRFMTSSDCTTENVLHAIYERVEAEVEDSSEEVEESSEGENAGTEDHTKEENAEDIDHAVKIRGLLEGKKYLVVVSGISSKTLLNCLRACLPDAGNGSRVVLALDIESEEVAQHANTMNMGGINGIHMLGRLDEERSGQLFCSRAFRKEASDSDIEEKLIKMYNKTVYGITGGHPLAIVVLAGLLRFKERPGQWDAVLQQLSPTGPPGIEMKQEAAALQQGGEDKNKMIARAGTRANNSLSSSTVRTTIERVFWESFENLPDGLKSCFLYFVAQPKDTSWHPDMAVRVWISEGFIKPQKGKTMEELGHNYLKELVLRCLVQIDEKNDVGDIKSVTVHRSLHGFLQSEAREAGFMEVHDMHDVFVPPSVRRLSFVALGGRFTTFRSNFPKLRSFICWVEDEEGENKHGGGHYHDLKFLLRSKFLRVLDIDGLRIKELPSEICDMVHLRYLRVINNNDLKELPSSIKRLLNLQTLEITSSQVKEIHQSFWKIKTLRHVLVDDLKLPMSIDEELDELQTLQGVRPPGGEEEWNRESCPLHKMTKLRTLGMHGINHDKHGAALESALLQMHLLRRLELQGDVLPLCIFKARDLRYLQEIKLIGMVEWPQEALNLRVLRPNLVRVNLKNSSVVPQCIIEELQNLGVKVKLPCAM